MSDLEQIGSPNASAGSCQGESDANFESLKTKKLELEIQQLRQSMKRFSWTFSLKDLVPIFITIATFLVAYSTGILDAKRSELATQKLLFQLETEKAELQAREIQEQVANLEKELTNSRTKLDVQERLRLLSQKIKAVEGCTFGLDLIHDPPRLSFSIKGSDKMGMLTRSALSELYEIRHGCVIDSISLAGMRLSRDNIERLVQLRPNSLSLTNNNIGVHEAEGLGDANGLTRLVLSDQRLKNMMWATKLTNLKSLTLEQAGLDAGTLNVNFAFADSLESISVTQPQIANDDLRGIQQFANLDQISLEASEISTQALRDLVFATTCNVNVTIPHIDVSDEAIRELAILIENLKMTKSPRKLLVMAPVEEKRDLGDGISVQGITAFTNLENTSLDTPQSAPNSDQ